MEEEEAEALGVEPLAAVGIELVVVAPVLEPLLVKGSHGTVPFVIAGVAVWGVGDAVWASGVAVSGFGEAVCGVGDAVWGAGDAVCGFGLAV